MQSNRDLGEGIPVRQATSQMTWVNYWDHFLARCGVNRGGHRVEPGR